MSISQGQCVCPMRHHDVHCPSVNGITVFVSHDHAAWSLVLGLPSRAFSVTGPKAIAQQALNLSREKAVAAPATGLLFARR